MALVLSSTLTQQESPEIITSTNATTSSSTSWFLVGEGIILSCGQVYALPSLVSSSILWFSLLLFSPILFLMALVGASIGCLTPLIFLDSVEIIQVEYIGTY